MSFMTFPAEIAAKCCLPGQPGVSYARLMNLHERNGDLLKIATLADSCGTRWQVNAIMILYRIGESFMIAGG